MLINVRIPDADNNYEGSRDRIADYIERSLGTDRK